MHLIMGSTLAILVTFGILLMILETFLPGMIAGTVGGLCVLAAVALVLVADDFAHWPAWGRAACAAGLVAVTVAVLLAWLRFFAVKFWRRGFTLTAEIASAPAAEGPGPGALGVALTELRPLGRADFGGLHREVRCEDGFAPAGAGVRVTGREPGNLIVHLQLQTP